MASNKFRVLTNLLYLEKRKGNTRYGRFRRYGY